MEQHRPLPDVSVETEPFWTGGHEGRLLITRCQDCAYLIHPPSPVCPQCLSRDVRPEAVSGRAEVVTFTINHQPWYPGLDVPYAVAIVELAEQPGLRLTANLVNCHLDEVRIGLAVQVAFERVDEVSIPVFEPVRS